MKSQLKNFIYLTVSTLIMTIGIYFFKFTNNFTFGGITGLAVLVAKSGAISASDFSFVSNMVLLVIGFFVLGKRFAAKTAYSSILLSVTLSALERIYPMSHPLTDQPMLELAFAIALPSIGSAVLFNIGASSGGTDVVAMIMKKYTSVLRYRQSPVSHGLFHHPCRMLRVRYRDRTVLIPWSGASFFHDRRIYRESESVQVF